MRRLIYPSPNGGIPYVSHDFETILQTENLKSYRAHLDAVNDVPLTTSATMSRGIIVKGIDTLTLIPPTTTCFAIGTYSLPVSQVSSYLAAINNARPTTSVNNFIQYRFLQEFSPGVTAFLKIVEVYITKSTSITPTFTNIPQWVQYFNVYGYEKFLGTDVTPEIEPTNQGMLNAELVGSDWIFTMKFSPNNEFKSLYPAYCSFNYVFQQIIPGNNTYFTTSSFLTTGVNLPNGYAKYNFQNSLIYLPGMTGPGDFLEPIPGLQTLELPYTNFWLIAATPSIDQREYYTGGTYTAAIQTYYDVTTVNPGQVPNIQFRNGKTARRYKRLFKYKMDAVGDVFMTGNLSNFNTTTGLGEGDKYGYALCDGQNGTLNLRGRYVLGYDQDRDGRIDNTLKHAGWYSSPGGVPVPRYFNDNNELINIDYTNANPDPEYRDRTNYNKIGNIGGGYSFNGVVYPSAFANLPQHPHKGGTIPNTRQIEHTHRFNAVNKRLERSNNNFSDWPDSDLSFGDNNRGWISDPDNNSNMARPTRVVRGKTAPQNNTGANEVWVTNEGRGAVEGTWIGGGGLGGHTHAIKWNGGTFSHETRPPYIVMAYYQKIAV